MGIMHAGKSLSPKKFGLELNNLAEERSLNKTLNKAAVIKAAGFSPGLLSTYYTLKIFGSERLQIYIITAAHSMMSHSIPLDQIPPTRLL